MYIHFLLHSLIKLYSFYIISSKNYYIPVCNCLFIFMYSYVYDVLGVYFLLAVEATLILTAPSSPPCFGQTYKLTCTHPVLVTSTLLWERNGVFFGPSASTTHDEDETSTTSSSWSRIIFILTCTCLTFKFNICDINITGTSFAVNGMSDILNTSH